ncbi:MAG: hypothetical protein ACLRZ2_04630 [Veillonella sp.]
MDLGKEHVFVMEPEDEGFLHEEDVARALYHMAGGEKHCTMALWHKVKLKPLRM